MNLATWGWDSFFDEQFQPYAAEDLSAGRVAVQHNRNYKLYTQWGELDAEASGRLRYVAADASELPVVGDWVVIRPVPGEQKAVMQAILPRKSQFSRKVAGRRTEEQVIAANIDTVFLVAGLDGDFNLRRLERYLILAAESGAFPVVVLNKSDLRDDLASLVRDVESIAPAVAVLAVSVLTGQGMEALSSYLGPGRTVALLGSSGVGKSSLINRLLGQSRQKIAEVIAETSRGRHTTTQRELLCLPSGGLVIDTPGMRELQLWSDGEGFEETFEEIEALALQCHFTNCRHSLEKKCAVQEAIRNGALAPERYESYLKVQRELAFLADKQQHPASYVEKQRWKKAATAIARMKKPR